MNDVIILAGGMGSRLRGMVNEMPKSMASIAGKPFLEYQLTLLANAGFHDVILSVGYLNEIIINHFGNTWKGINLQYSVESQPLGTGGAIVKGMELTSTDDVLVMNGDTLFFINLGELIYKHLASAAEITLALRRVPDAGRFGSVAVDPNRRIIEFHEKEPGTAEGLINGGIYIIRKSTLLSSAFPEKFSFETDFLISSCKTNYLQGIEYQDYFLDIGIPEDYLRAQTEFPKLDLNAKSF